MTALPALNAASPLDLSDDNRLTFTADLDETLNRALDNTPADFGTMDDLSWQVEYRVNAAPDDDTYDLNIRIVNGATILAAADSGGTFASVATNITSTTDTTSSVTAFAHVNTTADKTTWDGGSVEVQQAYTKTKGADNVSIEVDFVEFTGNYTTGASTTDQAVAGSLTPSGALEKQVLKELDGSVTQSGSLIKQIDKLLDGSSTFTGAIQALKTILQSVAGSITTTGALVTQLLLGQLNAGSVTVSGDILKQANKINAGTITTSGALQKQISLGVFGTITLSGVNQRRIDKILDGSLTPSGTVLATFVAMLSIAGTITMSGILATLFIPFVAAPKIATFIKGVVRGIFVSNEE